jgi:hypothetical protein
VPEGLGRGVRRCASAVLQPIAEPLSNTSLLASVIARIGAAMPEPSDDSVAPGEPRFPRIGPVGAIGVGLGPGVFAAGHAADGPGAAAKSLVQALEQPSHAVLGGSPPAAENAAVDARVHVADYRRPAAPQE